MNQKSFKLSFFSVLLLLCATAFVSCSDDEELPVPPGSGTPTDTLETNIASIRSLITKANPGSEPAELPAELREMDLQGVVVSDKDGGNSYPFILALVDTTRNGGAGIFVSINEEYNTFERGDVVKVSLSDATAQLYNSQLQISTANKPELVEQVAAISPIAITPEQMPQYEAQYVIINETQPAAEESGTWNDDSNKGNVTMEVRQGTQYKVRTMADASFAQDTIPTDKSGSMAGIVGVYNGTYQLNPCNADDINLTEARFTISAEKATLKEVLEGEAGTYYEVEDLTVVGTNMQGAVLEQNGDYIYAFMGTEHGLATGDVVNVSGRTESRNQLLQFGSSSTVEKTGETRQVSMPTPTVMTGADLESYAQAPAIKYATYEGTVLLSGNYTNVEIDDCDYQGSLDYMTEEYRQQYKGHKVTLTGWLFGSYKTFIYTLPVETVDQGIAEEDVPDGAIYYSSFDKELSSETFGDGGQWPYLDQFDGWINHKGSGVARVTYDYQSMSVRSNQSSKGSLSLYDGSGQNNIFFSTAPNYFTIEHIEIGNATNLKLSFGAQRYSQGATNTFIESDFEVRVSADGQVWSQALDYEFNTADEPGQWRLATANFTLPAATNELYVKFEAKYSSANRIDDVLLTEGPGGELVEYGKEEVTPLSTIAEVIASPIDQVYRVEGQVVGTHTKGFLVKDDTGIILVYKKKHGQVTGSMVTVEGATTEYGGLPQFGETSEVTVLSTGSYTQPQPEVFTAADFTAYLSNPTIRYIQYEGYFTSERNQYYQWYYNVAVEGTEAVGSLSYPDLDALNLLDKVDHNVRVTGYAIGVSGGIYVNTMVTSIEVID